MGRGIEIDLQYFALEALCVEIPGAIVQIRQASWSKYFDAVLSQPGLAYTNVHVA